MKKTYPISVKKNDYIKNPKNNCVDTPIWLSLFIFNIIPDQYKKGMVLDIACGNGNLSYRFENVIGIDILDYIYSDSLLDEGNHLKMDYLNECFPKDSIFNTQFKNNIKLIVCNPPFNDSKGIYKKKLLPELFFKKIISDFGPEFPFILFVPMGFRLNQRKKSKRYKFIRQSGAEITSILSLPIDIFKNVLFHSEVLFFNMEGMKAHYFIDDKDEF
jgi:type I restriction enzyme M protein